MARAIDPSTAKKSDYVVPPPRSTDALGAALRQAFRAAPVIDLRETMRRLDAVA